MELQNSAMFWSMAEQRLGANTKSIFKDQTLEVRLVNDARSLKLILLARRNDEVAAGGMDFEWYTQVAGGAIMTAAASVLHRPVNRPDVKISRTEYGEMVAILTDPYPEPVTKSMAYDPATLDLLVNRLMGTLNRATG